MKKIFCAVLALAAMASCSNEDTIEYNKQAIAFGDAFVDNATRAIYADANGIQGFTVFGNVIATSQVLTGTPVALYGNTGANVTRGGASLGVAWTCDVARYWTPSCTFNFAAIANGTGTDVVNGLPTKISYTVNENDPADLIYATQPATTTNAGVPETGVNGDEVVAFTFNHLLSKIGFTVDTDLDNGYTAEVTSIAVTGAYKNGTYTVGDEVTNGTWANSDDEKVDLQFIVSDSGVDHLIIPVNQTLGVTITYNILFNGTTISTGVTKEGPLTYSFATNTVYNINASLTAPGVIEFTVNETNGLGAWTPASSDINI